jgi:hypothetical protein
MDRRSPVAKAQYDLWAESARRAASTRVWGFLAVLAGLVGLFPHPLLAQPFDLQRARRTVVRVIADRGNVIGSGSIVGVSGRRAYVLTAYHVIRADYERGASQVKVEIFPDGTGEARISRESLDPHNDLAVLTVEDLPASPQPDIAWGSSAAVRETDRIWALGHPRGGPGWVVSEGTVGRKTGGTVYFSGTAVNPGNSGGPLLNAQGMVVGVILKEQGSLGRALEADVVQPIIRGWLPAPTVVPAAPQPPQPSRPPERVATWERTYGPSIAHEIHRIRDGGYILSGYTEQGANSRAFDALVMKLDQGGGVVWRRTFPTGGDDDLLYSVTESLDGGFVVGGNKERSAAWAAALDSGGKLLWERTFQEMNVETIWRIRRARDAGYILAGEVKSKRKRGNDLWLARLNRLGKVVWNQIYWNREWGEEGHARPLGFLPASDSGFLVAAVDGWTGRIWVLKLDQDGAVQWERTLPRKGNVAAIREARQGGYVLAGVVVTAENRRRPWVARLDREGRTLWEQEVDAAARHGLTSMSETGEGGYIAVGKDIFRLDARGGLLWKQEFEGQTGVTSIEQGSDGGYIAAGRKEKQVWVLKLDSEGRVGAGSQAGGK